MYEYAGVICIQDQRRWGANCVAFNWILCILSEKHIFIKITMKRNRCESIALFFAVNIQYAFKCRETK